MTLSDNKDPTDKAKPSFFSSKVDSAWQKLWKLHCQSLSDRSFYSQNFSRPRTSRYAPRGSANIGYSSIPAQKNHGIDAKRYIAVRWTGHSTDIAIRRKVQKPLGSQVGRRIPTTNTTATIWEGRVTLLRKRSVFNWIAERDLTRIKKVLTRALCILIFGSPEKPNSLVTSRLGHLKIFIILWAL